MKKLVTLGLFVIFLSHYSVSQTYTATIEIEKVRIDGLKAGDEIIIPLRLVEKSGGLIWGFQFFINYDHSVLTWKGTVENPLSGVKGFNDKIPYSKSDWLFNDTGYQIACSYTGGATSSGVDIRNGEIFLEYIFVYKGNLKKGEFSGINWGRENVLPPEDVFKGITEMYSELMDYFELKYNDGEIRN
jgi:hypothetical protein